jgi:hypothetical protein
MASARRIGAPDAKNRGVLLDAAEQLLPRRGYAAVTSRRVADGPGSNPSWCTTTSAPWKICSSGVPQAGRGGAGLRTALKSPQPLWALWRFSTCRRPRDHHGFMGLANHRKAPGRNRVPRNVRRRNRTRRSPVRWNATVWAPDVPPVVWTVFATSVSQTIVMERALGMSSGHAGRSSTARMAAATRGEPLPARDDYQLRSVRAHL